MLAEKVVFDNYDFDSRGNIRADSILKRMQEIAGRDVSNLGATPDLLKEKGVCFVLAKLRMKVFADISCHEEFDLVTAPLKTIGVSFYRNFIMKKSAFPVMNCATRWVLIDKKERKIARPSVIGKDFESNVLFDGYEIGKMPAFEEKDLISSDYRRIYNSMIDKNDHLNNCVYAELVFDAIPEKNANFEIGIDFLHEARENDLVLISCYRIEGGYFVRGERTSDKMTVFESFVKF